MARGTRWLLISCGWCLALAAAGATTPATASQPPTSSQHRTAGERSPATSGDTAPSAAPASSPSASRAPESESAPSPPPAPASPSSSPTSPPAASSRETHVAGLTTGHAAGLTTGLTTGRTTGHAAGLTTGHAAGRTTGLTTGLTTEWPGLTSGTAARGSAPRPAPGSATALQTTEEAPPAKQPSISQSPGLVAVICIFVIILALAAGVVMVKLCRRREPAFKKLDEVPMGKMTEDSPFARYPPK